MTIRDFALENLERSLNGLIALDPDALPRLARLHGKVIRLQLTGIELVLHFVPGHDGRLRLLGQIEGEPDCSLSGSPFDLMRASDPKQGSAQLFAGRVRIEGDQQLAQQFSEALAAIDIDWEEQLSRLTGDALAHEVGRATRGIRTQADRFASSATDNLSEYLTEEARLLPHRYEVEDFVDDVDVLRDDLERLEARIALLEKQAIQHPANHDATASDDT